MRKIAVQAGLVLALSLGSIACGGAGETDPGAGGGPGGSTLPGAGGSGSGGDDIEMPGDCPAPCAASEVCSVTGQCIPAGTCAADGDCSSLMVCEDGKCVPGGGCGAQEVVAELQPGELLIVLDRSCSMSWNTAAGLKKWDVVVGSLVKLLSEHEGKVGFGLTMFPDTDAEACPQGPIPYPVADGNEPVLTELLSQSLATNHLYYPNQHCGTTNIDWAMKQALTEPSLLDPERPGYVLLVTDGAQSGCGKKIGGGGQNGGGSNEPVGDASTVLSIETLLANHGVHTFVVGFAGSAQGASLDPKALNEFAVAGGMPASSPDDPDTKYYLAEDPESLDAALAAIAAKTIGCTLTLTDPPDDQAELYVFFNDTTSVAHDPGHQNGWDYSPATQQLTFYGAACQDLKSGAVTDVDVVFGCNEPTPK